MTAKEWLISTDKDIDQAVSNGYDIRLDEDELLVKMEQYHQAKLKLLCIADVVGASAEQLVCEECKKIMIEPYAERYGKKICIACM